jgi:hypothetical protein
VLGSALSASGSVSVSVSAARRRGAGAVGGGWKMTAVVALPEAPGC